MPDGAGFTLEGSSIADLARVAHGARRATHGLTPAPRAP